jgi:hypothetical protein
VGVLIVCDNVLALEKGKLAHEQIIESGYESKTMGSSLIYMYAKRENRDGRGFEIFHFYATIGKSI